MVFYLSFAGATLLLLTLVESVVLQGYIRWAINKDFIYLGGYELETLTVATVVFISILAYIYRPERK